MSSILFYSTRKSGALKGGHFQNCQHFCRSWRGTLWRKNKFSNKSLTMTKNWRGDPLGFLNTQSVVKHQRNWRGDPLERKKNLWKKSHNAEKLKGGPFGGFSTSILSQNSKKIEGGALWGKKFSRKKVSQCRKKIGKGDPLVLPGMVCYAGKQEKPFWFSSLDQIVQFGAIIFCRTFKNYFGQFVWIEKKQSHYNSQFKSQFLVGASVFSETRLL